MEKEQLQQQLHTTLQAADIQAFVSLAKQAIETYPEEAFANYYFGEALTIVPNPAYALAEQYFSKSLDLDADNLECWFKYANSQEQQLEFDDAANTYQLILQKDPENATAWLHLAWYYSRHAKNLNNALYYINLLQDADPEDVSTYTHRGEAYYNNDKFEEAIADFEYVLSVGFDTTAAVLLIESLKVLDRLTETFGWYELLIEENPEFFGYSYDYGVALLRIEEYEQAQIQFEHCLDFIPDALKQAPYTLQPIAETFVRVQKYPEAIELLDTCIAYDANKSAEFLLLRAEAKSKLSQFEEAFADLNMAKAYAKGNNFMEKYVISVHSLILLNQNKAMEAEQMFKELGKDPLFISESEYGLALVEHQKKNFRQSYHFIQKAIENGHPKAKFFLDTQLSEYLTKIRTQVLARLAPEPQIHLQHPMLKHVIGKFWKFEDIKSPEIPGVDTLVPEKQGEYHNYLKRYFFMMSEKEIFLHAPNPNRNEISRSTAYGYKITGEKGNLVQLQLISTDGETNLVLKIKVDNPNCIWIDKTTQVEELLKLGVFDPEQAGKMLKSAFVKKMPKLDIKNASPTLSSIIEELTF